MKQFKRWFSGLLVLCLCLSIVPAYTVSATSPYEYAWFPAPVMKLTQIAYENYSHGSQNAIDIAPGGTVFAPFTGKVVYTDANWGYVVLQSSDKVMWADGSCDYMTVGFMHDEYIGDLYVGKVIKQGEDFYHAGGMGDGNPNAYGDHVHITVHRGHVTRGRPYGTGDEYAFNAFFVNKEKTPTTAGRGEGYVAPGGTVNNGAPSDYRGLWKYLDDITKVPTVATLSINKSDFRIAEEFTLTLSADVSCNFWLSIVDADSGEYILSEQAEGTYKNSFLRAGHYRAWMSAYNSADRIDSNAVEFYVFGNPPTTATLSIDKTEMDVGETVTFTTSTDAYYVKILMALFLYNDTNEGTRLPVDGVPYAYSYTPTEPGVYTGYVSAYTHEDGVDSNWVTFHVGRYTVGYDANGGVGAPVSQIKYYGKDIEVSTMEPTRENHVFQGWATSPDALTADYLPGAKFTHNEDITLYAVWAHSCAGGHNYETAIVEPTCLEKGYTTYTCTVCDDSYASDYTDALGHEYKDGKCTRCGETEAPVVEVVASGWSGATTWTLTADGVLTFSGEGNMKNYGWGGGQPWAKYADQITSVVVENGVTAIGTGAFKDLTTLESVTLPDSGLKSIGQAAFYGCTGLKSIYIPDGVYTIWEYTFKNCAALEYIRLPKTLIKIDQGAFEACTGLTELFLPTNVQIIGGWSFKGCTAMKSVDMQWADATEIRPGAFKNCTALMKIVLPTNIKVLGDSCFYGICATSFVVPATVTEVQDWCFARSSIKEITFEGDAPAIGTGAFNKIELTAYYPSGNATWTADIMQNYGGTVAWQAN